MSDKIQKSGSELFIIDNSDDNWKVKNYLHEWIDYANSIDIATGFFEIGSLLALDGQWQKLDKLRILMGDEVSLRTQNVFDKALSGIRYKLDDSIEREKESNDFLTGVPAIVKALKTNQIECRVYRKKKFHAKAYITHGKSILIGSYALVGSSNFTKPGLTDNVELNLNITSKVNELQEWFDTHWNQAEDVTPDILKTIERHVWEYSPFEVYLKSLHEYFKGHQITSDEWERNHSKMYNILALYQQEGYHNLMKIAKNWGGAFLCDGVGLGKTFVGLMLLERLLLLDRKKVVLLVPKSARKPVWENKIKKYLPKILDNPFMNLQIFNHTDLLREPTEQVNYPRTFEQIKEEADVFIIDEAHNFRNTSSERYRKLREIISGNKEVYLLTATPINNTLLDLQHQIELFTNRDEKYFSRTPLNIHSLQGHFRKMEKDINQAIVDDAFARNFLVQDNLFRELVVQRSRAYVKKSLEQQSDSRVLFPTRNKPQVANYSLEKVYGNLLKIIELSFDKKRPLFSLPVYYPFDEPYYKGDKSLLDPLLLGRKEQIVNLIRILFLKRFESSVSAFRYSCENLLLKLLSFVKIHRLSKADRWIAQHENLLKSITESRIQVSGDEQEDDVFPEDLLFDWKTLDDNEFDVSEIVSETIMDMEQLVTFLNEINKLDSSNDDKLQTLIQLLNNDEDLKIHKVLIFTEFLSTARYLRNELTKAGFTDLFEIDSEIKTDRGEIIERFSPYYNEYSSEKLKNEGKKEIRILISTDVLSEGLNLQDGNLIINYDLHWNPVRLMQRIGRVDRRLDPLIESEILKDHPELKNIRGKVRLWNFLPPKELEKLLNIFLKVSHKTLRISKIFGIEGKMLLTPDDDYEALKEFNEMYEGRTSRIEDMQLKYNRLKKENPSIAEKLDKLPYRVFSGKQHPKDESLALFFCYRLPSYLKEKDDWSMDNSITAWYLYDISSGEIKEEPIDIDPVITCEPETQRLNNEEKSLLIEIRKKVEKHIHSSFMKRAQVPATDKDGKELKPQLLAWLELTQL